jgi:hypothetical protein
MSRVWQVRAMAAVAATALALWAWHMWWPSDERAIRRRLDTLAATVNEPVPDGLGTVTRAAEIGSYFTDSVTIDLGPGSTPIQGREPLIALATRMPSGAGGYTLQFDEVAVAVSGGSSADVTCAATLRRRNATTGEQSIDARELQLGLVKADGVWRIARVTALDTLRRE